MSSTSLFMKAKNFIAKHYGDNVGGMLIHTGVIAWVLSSAAQVTAIAINDKIPKEQKLYLIPQECADAAVNIASFYLITQSFKSIGSYLVKSGKWVPGSVRSFLDKTKFDKIGKITTNIEKDANFPIETLKDFSKFRTGMDFMITTLGSIISCNIVTPLIRNQIAAERQKKGLERMHKPAITMPAQTYELTNYLPKPRMIDFQSRSCRNPYYNSGSLKI